VVRQNTKSANAQKDANAHNNDDGQVCQTDEHDQHYRKTECQVKTKGKDLLRNDGYYIAPQTACQDTL